ncbi:MAG: hypothetical protein ABIB11_05745 [Candidatus Omnitrophota bacterium]
MKKLISLFTLVLFALSTACPANADFVSAGEDGIKILSAEIDLSAMEDEFELAEPILRDAATNGLVPGSNLTWTYDATKTWKVADQYIEIAYKANLPGWGIQLYTDNTNDNADPKWVEKPDDDDGLRPDSPGGLVGDPDNKVNHIAIPLAWKAFAGELKTDNTYEYPLYVESATLNETSNYKVKYSEPKELTFGKTGDEDYRIELYQYEDSGDLYGKYCWVMDKTAQKWVDDNIDSKVTSDEIKNVYADGSDINTVINYLGASTCTFDSTGKYVYREPCASPIFVVLAAKTALASIKSKYSTSTLTLELYHE